MLLLSPLGPFSWKDCNARSSLGFFLLAAITLLLTGCGWTRTTSTTEYRATIRVDGAYYTSETVFQSYRNISWGNITGSPYGGVLTFRLPDDRVIVVSNSYYVGRPLCAPRLDGSEPPCKARWETPNAPKAPDGYVFDNAVNPTRVEAFQFEPRSPAFAPNGTYLVNPGTSPVAVSDLTIVVVAYSIKSLATGMPQDSIEQSFPGYHKVHSRDNAVRGPANAMPFAASDLRVPLKRDR